MYAASISPEIASDLIDTSDVIDVEEILPPKIAVDDAGTSKRIRRFVAEEDPLETAETAYRGGGYYHHPHHYGGYHHHHPHGGYHRGYGK